ncbi:hypothetical protein B7494_g3607 [Chlorociboria aeruginascens]|nr:hypothetical protein B7494_g3607 [Chlorociboria aeruginascens]
MATTSPLFFCLWRDNGIRSHLLEQIDTASLCSLRLVSPELCALTTQPLFTRTHLTFTPSALTRPSRLESLSRIGHYIQHLTFSMPHSPSTFLPPLLNPMNGREVTFLYTPQTSIASAIQRPKYGSPVLGDVLTQQYPPLFHAATNVPAFITVFTHLRNLRHLTVSCPGQDPAQRYRRDVIDYALISLRIAIERAPLVHLEKLSLNNIHPSGLLYLRHMPGFGCTPSAGRRWKQIKKLNIVMDSWDFFGPQPGLDHLKILEDYIRNFSDNLERVSFGWNGRKGPCPFSLYSDPLFAPPRRTVKLFAEVTSLMSPLPAAPPRPAIVFPKLRYMQVRNATMAVEQVADFVFKHRHTVHEFDYENVSLINGGMWEDALAPLTRISGSDEWLSQQSGSEGHSYSSDQSQNGQEYIDAYKDLPDVIDTHFVDRKALIDTTVDMQRMSVVVTKRKKRVHRKRRRKHNHPKEEAEIPLAISSPVLTSKTLPPVAFDLNLQGVQRNAVQEAAQQDLADDPDKQVTTLRKAKEAVLKRLGKEFCKTGRKDHLNELFKNTCSAGWRSRTMMTEESTTALVPLIFSRY